MLEAMPSTQPWGPGQVQIYSMALGQLHDDLADPVMQKIVMGEKWRPAPARIMEIATETGAPFPDAEQCHAEIMEQMDCEGYYGHPRFSHPIIDHIVSQLGGWGNLCTIETTQLASLHRQVCDMHASLARRWSAEAVEVLRLPAADRHKMISGRKPVFGLTAIKDVLAFAGPRRDPFSDQHEEE